MEVSQVSQLSKEDFILYQISKSKKYDIELVAEEAERKGREYGKIERDIEIVITAHVNGFSADMISAMLSRPIEDILEIIEKYGEELPENEEKTDEDAPQ